MLELNASCVCCPLSACWLLATEWLDSGLFIGSTIKEKWHQEGNGDNRYDRETKTNERCDPELLFVYLYGAACVQRSLKASPLSPQRSLASWLLAVGYLDFLFLSTLILVVSFGPHLPISFPRGFSPIPCVQTDQTASPLPSRLSRL